MRSLRGQLVNSVAHGRFIRNLKHIQKQFVTGILSIFYENGPNWMTQNLTDDRPTLVHCCLMAEIHYLNQFWTHSMMMNGCLGPMSSTLFQVMVCSLFGTKSILEPMLISNQMDRSNKLQWNLNKIHIHQRKSISKCLQNVSNYGTLEASMVRSVWTLKQWSHFFQNIISFSNIIHFTCNIFCVELVQNNEF